MVYNQEFLAITQDIIEHPEFIKTQNITHHGQENSVYKHSMATAFFAYRVSKKFHLSEKDTTSITRAALLHDFTGYDWRDGKLQEGRKQWRGLKRLWHVHAFEHGFRAAENAAQYFMLTDKQKDAIRKHMFPLVPFVPKYKEGWIVTYSDKIIASKEMSFVVAHSLQRAYYRVRHAFA